MIINKSINCYFIMKKVADNCPVPFSIGQRVAGLTSSGYGGLAGQAVLRALNVWPLPSEVGSRDAAALVCGHSTALLAFTEHYQLNGSFKFIN